VNVLETLGAIAPALSEAIGLIGDIARRGLDPTATLARLRAILPGVLDAAEDGSTATTDDEWAAHLRKHFG